MRLVDLIVDLLKHHAKRIILFGSYARGDYTEQSDIDLIVEFRDRKTLLDLVRIEREISERIGKKVQILTPNSINKRLRDRILSEAVVIYEEG